MNEPAYEYYRVEIARGEEPAKPLPGSMIRGIRFSKIPTAASEVRIFDRAGNVVLFNSFAKAHIATDFHAQIVDDLLKMSLIAFRAKYNLIPDAAPIQAPQQNQASPPILAPGGFTHPTPIAGAMPPAPPRPAQPAPATPAMPPAEQPATQHDADPPARDPASMHYRVEHLRSETAIQIGDPNSAEPTKTFGFTFRKKGKAPGWAPDAQPANNEMLDGWALQSDQSDKTANAVRVVSRSGNVVFEQAVSDETEAARVQQGLVTDLLDLDVGDFLAKYRP